MTRIVTLVALMGLLAVRANAGFTPISQHLEAGPTGAARPDAPAHYSTSVDFAAVIGTHTWGYHETHAPNYPGRAYPVNSDTDVTTTLTTDQIVLNLQSTGTGYLTDISDAGSRATVHFLVPASSSISVIGSQRVLPNVGSLFEDGWTLTDRVGNSIANGPVPAGEYIFMGQSKITRNAGHDLGSTVNVTLTVTTPEPSLLVLATTLPLLSHRRMKK